MMNEKSTWYPFIKMNTDRSDKKEMYWWSFLDLHPKKEISLFDSFGFNGFKKNFHYKIIKKLLIKFSMELKNLKIDK